METLIRIIEERLNSPFCLDEHTADFLKSTHGLYTPDEIIEYAVSDDTGAALELISYPDESFRNTIEHLVPAGGFSSGFIQDIQKKTECMKSPVCIEYMGIRGDLSSVDSEYFRKSFVSKLGLSYRAGYLSGEGPYYSSADFFRIRSMLRRMNFTSSEENLVFTNELIGSYSKRGDRDHAEMSSLVSILAVFLKDKVDDPMDILAGKKFFYENVLIETEEFAKMMKSYSMEFIMMKKIQPPLVPVEEAVRMIRAVDLITLSVRGMVLPSVRDLCTNY